MAEHRLAPPPRESPAGSANGPAGAFVGCLSGSWDGRRWRIGVACARFNPRVTERLLDSATRRLDELGVASSEGGGRIMLLVPGAFELPLAARHLALSGQVDAVVCLGCVIRGETSHYDLVAGECASGLQRVQLDTGVPVIFGVLTTETLDQALARSGGEHGDKGAEAAETAVEVLNVLALAG
ncbi:MAG: 6,7-dimethyl-8-ribityllumazine synthase [Acidimicrobiales bacterium]